MRRDGYEFRVDLISLRFYGTPGPTGSYGAQGEPQEQLRHHSEILAARSTCGIVVRFNLAKLIHQQI